MIQTTLGALVTNGRLGAGAGEEGIYLVGPLGGGGVLVTVTETAHTGPLLILLCDLGQDTVLAGNSDSQIPGYFRST